MLGSSLGSIVSGHVTLPVEGRLSRSSRVIGRHLQSDVLHSHVVPDFCRHSQMVADK